MDKEKSPSIRALALITKEKSALIAADILKANGIIVKYSVIAQGTASSEILDMLGLGSTEKRMLISILPKQIADTTIKKLHEELSLHKADGGIAFTIPLTGVSAMLMKLMNEQYKTQNETKDEENIMSEHKFTLIATVVNRGFGGDVMAVARENGAKGGTIVNSRQLVDEETTGFWGMSMQEEKEILLIITEIENKLPLMKAISENFGLHSDAKGIVTSMPIDTVSGI